MRVLWLCLSVLLLSACGGNGAIFLTIEGQGPLGNLRVPDDLDTLSVRVTNDDASVEYLARDYVLDPATHRFPLTLGLEQGEKTDSPVRLTVIGRRVDQDVTRSTALVPIPRESVLSVTLRLTVEEAGP